MSVMKKNVLVLMMAALFVMALTTGIVFAADKDISSGYDFKYDQDFTGDFPGDDFFDGGFYVEENKPFTPKLTVVDGTGEVVPADAYTVSYQRVQSGTEPSPAAPPFVVSAAEPECDFIVVVAARSGSGYTGSFQSFIGVTAKHWMNHYSPMSLSGKGITPVYDDDWGWLDRYDIPAGNVAVPDLSFYGRVLGPENYTISWYKGTDKTTDIVPENKVDSFPYKEGDYLFVVTGKAPYHGTISQKMHIIGSVDKAPEYPSGYDTGQGGEAQHEHDYQEVPGTAVQPTCEKAGKKADMKCSKCDSVITGEVIGKIAHTLVKTEAKDAAPDEAGNTEYWTCTGCGKFFGDEKGTKEIAKDSWVIPPTDDPEIKPLDNPMKASGRKVTVKYTKLKKKNQTIKTASAFNVKAAEGGVSYKVKTYDKKAKKKIIVSSSGKVTVKKGLKKGKYTLKVNVTAKGNESYKAKTTTVTLTVTVK